MEASRAALQEVGLAELRQDGDVVTSRYIPITAEESDDFVLRYRDGNILHRDDAVAQGYGFKMRIAPAALIFAKALGLAYELGLTDNAIFTSVGLNFQLAVYPADMICVQIMLLKTVKTYSRLNRRKVTIRDEVIKHGGGIVQTGEWTGTLPIAA